MVYFRICAYSVPQSPSPTNRMRRASKTTRHLTMITKMIRMKAPTPSRVGTEPQDPTATTKIGPSVPRIANEPLPVAHQHLISPDNSLSVNDSMQIKAPNPPILLTKLVPKRRRRSCNDLGEILCFCDRNATTCTIRQNPQLQKTLNCTAAFELMIHQDWAHGRRL